ncbi:hypothetical protein B0T16DRAFT_441410 [Cercophora newfieldiana]|uniref:HhH-GPD domain-containing protein n=1 Tax=Cercophora newfieldiana TaxID=92897 RepID=A0AA39YS76_9PEZI|nr:hypothetical protein B0T16DRAFT_441410 [Cercophora newfieldiana]
MRTRGAARKAAEALKLSTQDDDGTAASPPDSGASEIGGEPHVTANTLATSIETPVQPNPAPTLPEGTPDLGESAAGEELAPEEQTQSMSKPVSTDPKPAVTAPKRKRGKAAPRQPMKGGWVLPHGMGASLGPVDASASNQDKGSPSEQGAQDDTPSVSSTPTQLNGPEAPTKPPGKQTRIGFRVTKRSDSTKQESLSPSSVPIAEKADSKHDEQEPLPSESTTSTRRTRSATVRKIVQETTKDQSALVKEEDIADVEVPAVTNGAVLVKEENPMVVADISADISSRKLLVIKGVAIVDDNLTKLGEKIIVDTTQILDPNFRMMLKRGLENKYGLTPGFSPYPYRRVPTPEDCEEVYRLLAEMHGECIPPKTMPAASLTVAGCGEVPCVLDALLRTLISGYTKMEHADQAIQNLVQHYGTRKAGTGKGSIDWEKVRHSPHGELKKVIEVAGGGNQKAKYIKSTLDMVYEENLAKLDGEIGAETDLLSLDYMHSMTKDEALAKFVSYPGIGIKTAACVTLFCLQMPCFAVDTHVHRFCRWLGWTPPKADPDNCFRHADHMVPDLLKYGLHQLFIRHGQLCFKCRSITKPGTKDWNKAPDCPLEHLLTRTKDEAASVKRKRDVDDDGSDDDEEEDEDEIKPKTKKAKMRKAKAEKSQAQDDSDVDDEEDEEEIKHKNKKPRTRKAKAEKPPVQEDSDAEMESANDEPEAAGDEAQHSRMELDQTVPVTENLGDSPGNAESDSELSDLEPGQFEMEIDADPAQKEEVNNSQSSTAASSVLSELSQFSDLTDPLDAEEK